MSAVRPRASYIINLLYPLFNERPLLTTEVELGTKYWLLDVTDVTTDGGGGGDIDIDIGKGDPMLPLLRSSLRFEFGGERAVKSISIEPGDKQVFLFEPKLRGLFKES